MRRRAAPPGLEADSPEAAYAAAVKKLAHQPLTRALLADRLVRAGFSAEAVAGAVQRIEEQGYLNDAEFAQALVRRRSQGRGRALIARELRVKGVDEATVARTLELVDDEHEAGRAMGLARQLVERHRPSNPQALRALVGPRLSRRGFPSGLIHRVCTELSNEWFHGVR